MCLVTRGKVLIREPDHPTRSMLQLNRCRVAIDILGPLHLTPRGNRYLLVMRDYFTKWVEALPIPNQEAETVANALTQQFFSRLGVPQELHSDPGRNFESRVFNLVCERLGVHKTRTTPYRS